MLEWRKRVSIENQIARYLEQSDSCLELFVRAMETLLTEGPGEAFEHAVTETHKMESSADDLRRAIELELYGRALLPESRGDLLGLLESYDLVLGAAETALYELSCVGIGIPESLVAEVRELVEINHRAYVHLRKTVNALMENPPVALAEAKTVDHWESVSDRKERSLIRAIFASDLDAVAKLTLKEAVAKIGEISNIAERVADRVGIITLKRNI